MFFFQCIAIERNAAQQTNNDIDGEKGNEPASHANIVVVSNRSENLFDSLDRAEIEVPANNDANEEAANDALVESRNENQIEGD